MARLHGLSVKLESLQIPSSRSGPVPSPKSLWSVNIYLYTFDAN